jgi:hypothetical protein
MGEDDDTFLQWLDEVDFKIKTVRCLNCGLHFLELHSCPKPMFTTVDKHGREMPPMYMCLYCGRWHALPHIRCHMMMCRRVWRANCPPAAPSVSRLRWCPSAVLEGAFVSTFPEMPAFTFDKFSELVQMPAFSSAVLLEFKGLYSRKYTAEAQWLSLPTRFVGPRITVPMRFDRQSIVRNAMKLKKCEGSRRLGSFTIQCAV